MPRYFFHLWTGTEYRRDDEGSELATVADAYAEAFETAQDVAIDLIRNRKNASIHRFDVVDDSNRLILEVPFSEIVGSRAAPYQIIHAMQKGHDLVGDVSDQIVAARIAVQELGETLQKLAAVPGVRR
jgi:hypothetical protein